MKLIDKDALVAEIENLLDKGRYHEEYDCAYRDGNNSALYALKEKIDTLEVKEVDLEDAKKEELRQKYVDYTFKRHNIDANSKEGQLIYYAYMHGMNQCLNQLKAQKGEKYEILSRNI